MVAIDAGAGAAAGWVCDSWFEGRPARLLMPVVVGEKGVLVLKQSSAGHCSRM
jgi:hypothetical protein